MPKRSTSSKLLDTFKHLAKRSNSSELLEAFKHLAIVGSRQRTRIVCIYGLSGQIPQAPGQPDLTKLYEFGRFAAHVETVADLLPQLAMNRE